MLAATADALITIFRREVDDLPAAGYTGSDGSDGDCLWKDAELYTYMTEAADAVASDGLVLSKIVTLAFDAGAETIPLPASVLHINSARLVSTNQVLRELNTNEAAQLTTTDYGVVRHELFESSGTPKNYTRDYDKRALRLTPTPEAADSLELQCTVTLAAPMACGAPIPFTAVKDQRLMLLYMKYLAYDKHDAETFDRNKSASYKAQFDALVLRRQSELRSQRRRPDFVTLDW